MDTDFDTHRKVDVTKKPFDKTETLRVRMGMSSRIEERNILPARDMKSPAGSPTEVVLSLLVVNPYQPRRHMDQFKLAELADSIKNNSLLQPIVVFQSNDNYVIVLGHRRVRAHELLGLKVIKAIIIKEPTRQQLISMVLIENIQREDLNPIELAISLRSYLDEKHFKTADALAQSIGKSPSLVSRYLSLLTLPDEIIDDISINNTITDMSIIDALRKQELKVIPTLYKWYKDERPSRAEFLERIKELSSNKTEKTLFAIKRSKNKTTVTMPNLTDSQEEQVRAFMVSLLK